MTKIASLIFFLSFMSVMSQRRVKRQFNQFQDRIQQSSGAHEYTPPFKDDGVRRVRFIRPRPSQYSYLSEPYSSHENLPYDHPYRKKMEEDNQEREPAVTLFRSQISRGSPRQRMEEDNRRRAPAVTVYRNQISRGIPRRPFRFIDNLIG